MNVYGDSIHNVPAAAHRVRFPQWETIWMEVSVVTMPLPLDKWMSMGGKILLINVHCVINL